MVLRDWKLNRTRLGQRENSLLRTHAWKKAGNLAGGQSGPRDMPRMEESLSLPWPLRMIYAHAHISASYSFSPIVGNPPAGLYVPISPPQRVQTCFFSFWSQTQNPRKGLYWYNTEREAIFAWNSWRVTRMLFQLGLNVFPWNERGKDL